MFGSVREFFHSRTSWSSERAFVFATIAAAVGLGNIWRFPYLAGENGGAAFVAAYVIAVIVLGIPLMVVELGAGRMYRGSPVETFRQTVPYGSFLGWIVVGLTLIIMSYYLVVTGWTLAYTAGSMQGVLKPFGDFLAGYDSLIYFGLVAFLTAVVVTGGVKFIEVLAKVLMPLLAIIVFVLTLYSVTLPGAGEAMTFLFQPDMAAFAHVDLWLLAFGQAFYSLALGQGYLITYGSFLPERVNIPRAVGIVAVTETMFAIVAGVMLFPVVFTLGLDPASGSQLAFETLPRAFDIIDYGSILAVFFFSLFFLAAFSSCVAGVEVAKTAFKEEFKHSDLRATLTAFGAIVPLGVLAALSFSPIEFSVLGRPFLEVLDLFAANQVVVISALVGGALISWFVPRDELVTAFGSSWRGVAWWILTLVRYLPFIVAVVMLITWVA